MPPAILCTLQETTDAWKKAEAETVRAEHAAQVGVGVVCSTSAGRLVGVGRRVGQEADTCRACCAGELAYQPTEAVCMTLVPVRMTLAPFLQRAEMVACEADRLAAEAAAAKGLT